MRSQEEAASKKATPHGTGALHHESGIGPAQRTLKGEVPRSPYAWLRVGSGAVEAILCPLEAIGDQRPHGVGRVAHEDREVRFATRAHGLEHEIRRILPTRTRWYSGVRRA